MPSRWKWLLLCLPVVAAIFATASLAADPLGRPAPDPRALERPAPPPLAGSEPRTEDPWHDAAWLAAHFDRACAAVEWACDARFRRRPGLRSVTHEEFDALVARHVALEVEAGMRKASARDEHATAGEAIGMYLAQMHLVCVCREHLDSSIACGTDEILRTADGLRVILVHEAAHALDLERFPELGRRREEDAERRACCGVVEGHAQHVARRVARAWGLDPVFAALRANYVDPSEGAGGLLGSWAHLAYVEGQDFMDVLYAEGGREAVDATLGRPPKSEWDVRGPGSWLAELRARGVSR